MDTVQQRIALRLAGSLILLAVTTTGCFTTKVYSRATPSGPVFQEGQWFALGGLVELSPPGGAACKELAYAHSKLSATDVIIDVGLAFVGALAVSSRCDASDATCRSTANLTGSLLPWLFGRRTVEYQCAGGKSADAGGRGEADLLQPAAGLSASGEQQARVGSSSPGGE